MLQSDAFHVVSCSSHSIVRNSAPEPHLQVLTRIFLSDDAALHACTQCYITMPSGVHPLTLRAPKRFSYTPYVVITKAAFRHIRQDQLLRMAAGCQPALLH